MKRVKKVASNQLKIGCSEKKGVVLGPSNQLKIAEYEAYGSPFIATRGFRARQKSYGNTSRVKFEKKIDQILNP